MRAIGCTLALLLMVPPPPAGAALSGDDRRQKIKAAQQASSLTLPGMKPWHLTLAVQLYDAKGQPGGQGTIEEWWAAEKSYRVVFNLPDYKGTDMQNAAGFFRSKGVLEPPQQYVDVLEQFEDPLASALVSEAEAGAMPVEEDFALGGVKLDCVMFHHGLPGKLTAPLGFFPTFCFSVNAPDLRLSFELGSPKYVRNQLGKFRGQSIPTALSVSDGKRNLATVKLAGLRSEDEASMPLKPTDDLEPLSDEPAILPEDMSADHILKKAVPIYPDSARRDHLSGTVVVHGLIGRDGHVYRLHIVSAPSVDLGRAALDAVQQWTYKPYLVKGVPTEVDTTMRVNFDFRFN